MKSQFIISQHSFLLPKSFNGTSLIGSSKTFRIHSNFNYVDFDRTKVIIDGFVIPRNNIFADYKQFSQHELIYNLYKKYGNNFAQFIKGFFCILIVAENECLVINDIHSVKRFLIVKDERGWLITNDLSLIKGCIDFRLSPYSPALQAIFQHSTKGNTIFENIEYSQPSSLTIVNDNGIENKIYFNESTLISSKKDQTDQLSFFNTFENSINNYLEYLKPKNISATLTGGRDTRSILSVLLKLGVKPHCFTYGYSSGIDVITSKSIVSVCGLNFSNHFIQDLNEDSYADLVNEIISINNPFINIHRAHRYDAIKKEEMVMGGSLEMVFVGAMGGDYIKGEKFNDYILTEFLRRYLTEQTPEVTIIKEILEKHFLIYNDTTIDYLQSYLHSFGLKHNTFDKLVEFNLVHNIIGCTHDIQDINLFLEHSKYVIAPFMDIDVMEALFTSPFSMFSNSKHTQNPFLILKGGELQCALIKKYSPILADVDFTNQYSPNDVLGNRLKYVIKRVYAHAFKIKPKPTFSYDEWFVNYVRNELKNINPAFKEFYNLNLMNESLNNQHPSNEGYWHKISNPIMINQYLNFNNSTT